MRFSSLGANATATAVSLGGVACLTLLSVNDTEAYCTIPPFGAPGAVAISVLASNGNSFTAAVLRAVRKPCCHGAGGGNR